MLALPWLCLAILQGFSFNRLELEVLELYFVGILGVDTHTGKHIFRRSEHLFKVIAQASGVIRAFKTIDAQDAAARKYKKPRIGGRRFSPAVSATAFVTALVDEGKQSNQSH